jgi:hypothetical protein
VISLRTGSLRRRDDDAIADYAIAAVIVSRWQQGKYQSGLQAGNELRSMIASELVAERKATLQRCVRAVEGASCQEMAIQQMRSRNR